METKLKEAVEKMAEGKEEGFNVIYSETYNRVYFRAKQIMKNEEDTLDLVQIVYIEAYKNINSLQTPEALYGWLDGITYRQGMKIFRKKKDVLLTEESEGVFEALENNDISSMPELSADQKATSEIIMAIVEELPELQKMAVIAYYFDGLKVEQIADMMECSTGTIKSRLNYARKYIKDRIEEKEKNEGYRLHVFGLPVLWFSLKMLSDKTTITVEAAQGIYNSSCTSVGLSATTLGTTSTTIAGTSTLSEMLKTMGVKFTSLSMGIKASIIVGTLAVTGASIGGVIFMNSQANSDVVKTVKIEEDDSLPLTIEDDLSKYLCVYISNGSDKAPDAIYPHKVSDKEYRVLPEDLSKYGNQVEIFWRKIDAKKLPEGIKLAVAYNPITSNVPEEMMIPLSIREWNTDAYGININCAEGLIIKLVDTTTTPIDDAWSISEDYSEFIKMYQIEVTSSYQPDYKYNQPTLLATKVSDDEYRFYVEDLKRIFSDGQTVGVRLNLPSTIEIVSVVGEDFNNKGNVVDFYQINSKEANSFYFPLSIGSDVIVKVKKYDENNKSVEKVEQEKIEERVQLYKTIPLGEEKYDKGELALEATKISDNEYCFYTSDLTKSFTEGEFVYCELTLPENTVVTEFNLYSPDRGKIVNQANIVPITTCFWFFIEPQEDIIIRTADKEAVIEQDTNINNNNENTVEPNNSNVQTWNLTDTMVVTYEDGIITVSGSGDMPDYNNEKYIYPWTTEINAYEPLEIHIEEGITSVSSYAFSMYAKVNQITLPSTLKSIGKNAFSSIGGITEIIIPEGVTVIGEGAFAECERLEKAVIPSSVTEIGSKSFMHCKSNFTIYGVKGSYAETYAIKNEKNFQDN